MLDRLPEGMDAYAAAEGDFKPLLELVTSIAASDEQAPQKDLMAAMSKAGITSVAGGFVLDVDGAPFNGVQLTGLKDVAAAKPAIEGYLKQADGMEQQGLRTTIEEAGTMEVGGVTLRRVITDLEVVEPTEAALQAVKMFRLFFGEAGQEQAFGYLDDAVLNVAGGGDDLAREAVAHATGDSDHPNEALAEVRAMLPKKGNLFAAIDLAGVVQGGLAVASEKGLFPILPAEMVRSVSVESSYSAFVVTVDGDSIAVEGVLPESQVRNLVSFGKELQGGAQQF